MKEREESPSVRADSPYFKKTLARASEIEEPKSVNSSLDLSDLHVNFNHILHNVKKGVCEEFEDKCAQEAIREQHTFENTYEHMNAYER